MAVSTTHTIVRYAGTGTLAPYPVTFQFIDPADLIVTVTDEDGSTNVLSMPDDYTVAGGRGATGSIIPTNVITSGQSLLIQRNTRIIQPVTLVETGEFNPRVVENQLDRSILIMQEVVGTSTNRILRVSSDSDELPPVDASSPNNTVFGFLGDSLKLLSASELLTMISLNGEVLDHPQAVWTDDTQRALKVPNFIGQKGVQTNDRSEWIATSLVAGGWTLSPLHDTTLGGLGASVRRSPTQESVRSYIETIASEMASDLNDKIDELFGSIGTQGLVEVPVGGCIIWPAASAIPVPTGFMRCQGQALSRTTYSTLFAKVGTTWGNGDGSSTFNLPDVRGLFPRFRDAGAGRDPNAGARTAIRAGGATGDAVGSFQGDQTKAHSHGLVDGGHNHASVVAQTAAIQQGSGTVTTIVSGTIPSNTSNNTTGATVASAGGDETRPANVGFDLIIKVDTIGNPASVSGGFCIPFEIVQPSNAIPSVGTTIHVFRFHRACHLTRIKALVWDLDSSGTFPTIMVKASGVDVLNANLACDQNGVHEATSFAVSSLTAGAPIDVQIKGTGHTTYSTPKGLVVWFEGTWND